MIPQRTAAAAAILFVVLTGVGIAWAAQSTIAASSSHDDEIVVETDGKEFEAGDTIRIRIRNDGERSLTGSPRLLVLNEAGGVQQSFAFAQFHVELEPGESVWVDWATGPAPDPCWYGKADASGAPVESDSRPCPMPMGGGDDPSGVACYPCPPRYGLRGTFVLVGIFGEHADAHVVRID